MNLRSVSRRASRVLLGATLAFVALSAVSATAMAAPVSGLSLPPDGKVKRVSGASLPSSLAASGRNALDVEALAPPNGNDAIADALGLPIADSICRFPNFCFLSDDNTEATEQPLEESLACNGEAYDNTLWYFFQVDRAGLLDVIINNTAPNGGGAASFRPSFFIFNADTGSGFCGVASPVTTDFGSTFEAGPGTTLGTLVAIQIGAHFAGTDGGTYDLNLRWHPDSDGDTLLDGADRCPSESGPTGYNGCPDSDGDTVPNPDDACPNQHRGAALDFRGCPDSDGDRVPENGQDRCLNQDPGDFNRRDRNSDGCADIVQLRAGFSMGVGGAANGVTVTSFTITNVERRARVEVICKRPNGRRCGRALIRRASTASVRARAAVDRKIRKFVGNNLSYGTTITVRVTARFAAGECFARRLSAPATASRDRTFCTRPGSRKLRKRGCV